MGHRFGSPHKILGAPDLMHVAGSAGDLRLEQVGLADVWQRRLRR